MRTYGRQKYLDRLVSAMGTDQVKIVTGLRRSGKTYLLFNLFKSYLLNNGYTPDQIVEMSFDTFENVSYRDPNAFFPWVKDQIGDKETCFVLLDEVQLLGSFVEVLNSLIRMPGVDVYVTGSNAKLLSQDIVTEFRGRGQEIHMRPLSFLEFYEGSVLDKRDAYEEYVTYGGLPAVALCNSDEDKIDYLKNLFSETYVSDLIEHNGIRDPTGLEELIDVLCSNIGCLTNASKISNTFKSNRVDSMSPATVSRYIDHITGSFLFEKASRYDIKGRKNIGASAKYYATDLGLRNVRLSFRQIEETHLMENALYNELRGRGWGVDVGVVPVRETDEDGKQVRKQLECDFVCNKGSRRIYIQSAHALPDEEKWKQEQASLVNIDDSFKKVIVTKEGRKPFYNNQGILVMNVFDFMLDERSLEF